MRASGDYNISKIEKGPLQRFKNQNLLLKKFGELGLQVYKTITGKRTTMQMQKDLDIEPEIFKNIISYMQEAGIVELKPATGAPKEPEKKPEEVKKPKEEPAKKVEAAPPAEKEEPVEEIAPDEEISFEEIKPLGEEEKPKEKEPVAPVVEEKVEEKPPEPEPVPEPEPAPEEEISFDEIKPIGEEEEALPEEKVKEELPPKEPTPEEKAPEEKKKPEALLPEEELTLEEEEVEELSPVEKIIRDKYGEVGLKVYTLIDGHRTAEQIMKETGLSEAKLVEILDFMDEQGIIKLEYPKEKKATEEKPMPTAIEKEEFAPMLEEEKAEETLKAGMNMPMKAPLDVVKSVQLKAKIMLKLGKHGGKLFDEIDGKKDIIDLAMSLELPLYEVEKMLRFLLAEGAVVIKPLKRLEVKKKYGDDGYAVYKKYGKEGLMLYELIGKEMTIKEMANKVSKDKEKVVEMFVFIHKVLGIDLPIDKELLYKQFGTAKA